jgi:hypothetical protein
VLLGTLGASAVVPGLYLLHSHGVHAFWFLVVVVVAQSLCLNPTYTLLDSAVLRLLGPGHQADYGEA